MDLSEYQRQQRAKIAASFTAATPLEEIMKAERELDAEEDDIEKAGTRQKAFLGEKRMFGGREYIKTNDGWKFHGKGTGKKAQEHIKSGETKEKVEINSPLLASHMGLHGKTFDVEKVTEHQFASGAVKYYHVKDEDGNTHEVAEEFIKKTPSSSEKKEEKSLPEAKSFDDLTDPAQRGVFHMSYRVEDGKWDSEEAKEMGIFEDPADEVAAKEFFESHDIDTLAISEDFSEKRLNNWISRKEKEGYEVTELDYNGVIAFKKKNISISDMKATIKSNFIKFQEVDYNGKKYFFNKIDGNSVVLSNQATRNAIGVSIPIKEFFDSLPSSKNKS